MPRPFDVVAAVVIVACDIELLPSSLLRLVDESFILARILASVGNEFELFWFSVAEFCLLLDSDSVDWVIDFVDWLFLDCVGSVD